MLPYEFTPLLLSKYSDLETSSEIIRTCRKIHEHFSNHENILISVSGGSDSDCIVHLVCTYFPEFLYKCNFVFINTGLEFQATKNHINDIKEKYKIEIEEIRGKSVVWAVKKYGIPFLNKSRSKSLSMYLRGTPKGHYLVFEANGTYYRFSDNERRLALYLKEKGIMVSSKCCDISKKKPAHDYMKKNKIDLNVTGERKAEGGVRATAYSSCFHEYGNGEPNKFMPLYRWTDDVKAEFKRIEGFSYSDCYEVYGMKRTGCTGCPFGKDTYKELEIMSIYEPQLYKACINVFGESYRLTDLFECRKHKKYFHKSEKTT